MIGINSGFIIISIGRHAIFHFKKVICIAVDFRLWRCSQSDHDRIEIFENRTIFLENTSVAFVCDNEVKMSR